jgi:hypothetical protein
MPPSDRGAPGVYSNDVEVCAKLGDFVKGLDAPVTVTTPGGSTTGGETTGATTAGPPLGSSEPPVLARTGLSEPVTGVVLLALGTGAALLPRRRFIADG